MKGFTWDREESTVVEYEAETFGYPHRTTNGETQYKNRHFRTEAEAWTALIGELKAGVSLGESARRDARKRFEKATIQLADAAEALVRAERALEDRVRDGMEVAKP